MPRVSTFGRFATTAVAALGALVLLAGQARAQYEYEWGRALMEQYGLEDIAQQVFTDLAASSNPSQKTLGLLGQSQLARKMAARSDDVAERVRQNDKAVAMLDQVSKSLGAGHERYWPTQFELAQLLTEIASDDVRAIENGEIAADKIEELQKTNQNRLDRAQNIYALAESEFAGKDRDDEFEDWFQGKSASLNLRILELIRAQLMPEKMRSSPTRLGALAQTLEDLDDLILDTDGLLIGFHGYYWRARVQEEIVRSGGPDVEVDDVVAGYYAVPDLMIVTPSKAKEWGVDFEPNPPGALQLAERAYWSLLEFLNDQGRTAQAIDYGERLRRDWADAKYPYTVLGDLARVELARAYQKEGRSGEALEIAAAVSEKGGYQGREADKVMSLIIATTPDKRLFDPKMLAAGANGAFAGRKEDPRKFTEAMELYRAVIANLERVTDEVERNELGRLSWFRLGIMSSDLNRYLDAALSFEQGYRNFNNEHARELPRLNADMQSNWLRSLQILQQSTKRSEAATRLLSAAQRYVAENEPAGGATNLSPAKLKWTIAQQEKRAGNTEAALKVLRELAEGDGANEYSERAMVQIAAMEIDRLAAKEGATAEEWLAAAAKFDEYREYVRTHPQDDPTRLESRKSALVEADMNIARALMEAAKASEGEAQKKAYERVATATEGFAQRTSDSNAAQYMRYLRFQALANLDRTDEAEKVFHEMRAADPEYRNIPDAAKYLGNLLKARAEAMPTITELDVERRDAVKKKAADIYRFWLLDEKPNQAGYWTLVYNLYYDTENWEEAYELLAMAYEKFKTQRAADSIRRKLGHTLLERAKIAFNEGETAKTDELFKQAAEIYKDLLGTDDNAPTTVLEEAGEVLGGFVVGPNRIGNYTYYPGTGEFERAQRLWHKVYQRVARKAGETLEEQREIDQTRQRARFYTYLMQFKSIDLQGDPIKARAALKSNLETKFLKEQNEPGGPNWVKKYEWLMRQL